MHRPHLPTASQRAGNILVLVIGFTIFSLILCCARALAQSPCDSCASAGALMDRWGVTGPATAAIQLRGGGRVVVDRVRRIMRETNIRDGRPVQCLRVWHGEGGSCRDTVVVNTGSLSLHRETGGAGRADVPILQASEYACDELLAMTGPIIGVGVVLIQPGNDPYRLEFGSDGVVIGAYASLGVSVSRDVEISLNGQAYSIEGNVRIPVFARARWMAFGAPETRSEFHYVPTACRFMAPGERGTRPSRTVCNPIDIAGVGDSTVYVAEERWSQPRPFVPYLYAEAGLVLNGSAFETAGVGPYFNDDPITQYLAGFGIGMPLGRVFNVGLGYRYIRENINAFMLTVGAEFR
jgi:hypothetical protein